MIALVVAFVVKHDDSSFVTNDVIELTLTRAGIDAAKAAVAELSGDVKHVTLINVIPLEG